MSLWPNYFCKPFRNDSLFHLISFFFCITLFSVSEGALIARKELSFLAGVYFVSTALLPPVLRKIRGGGGPVVQVWICFALFQLFRSACFLGRILATRGFSKKKGNDNF